MIGVVHLVWAPLGVDPLRAFLRSYHAHDAGVPHELIVVLNGLDVDTHAQGATREALLAELRGTEHRTMELERAVLDLVAYGEAARRLKHDRLCFLNSYCVIGGEDWLAHLSRALDEPDVGLVGASASWESQAEWIRGKARYWPYQLARVRRARSDFPRFPNPHVRTRPSCSTAGAARAGSGGRARQALGVPAGERSGGASPDRCPSRVCARWSWGATGAPTT